MIFALLLLLHQCGGAIAVRVSYAQRNDSIRVMIWWCRKSIDSLQEL
jgi:hypothetical protein